MEALIVGAETRLPESLRPGLSGVSRAAGRASTDAQVVVVIADPDARPEDGQQELESIRHAHPGAWLIAIVPADRLAAAFAGGADDVVDFGASAAELEARIRRAGKARAGGDGREDGSVGGGERPSSGTVPFVDPNGQRRASDEVRRLMTLGTVSTGLAHDFNNLLTVILGNAAFLKDELPRGESVHRLLRDLEQAATRAGDLTEQILRYADSGDEGRRAVDLGLLVRDATPFLSSTAAFGADLRLELVTDHLEVDAETSSLTQLLVNLVQNATESVDGGRPEVVVRTGQGHIDEVTAGRLEPRYALRGPAVFVEVEDNGQGMNGAIISQAFEPFFSTRGAGRGLGLSVVREVARVLGGGVEIDSEPGEGTRVRVWLPPSLSETTAPDEPPSTERLASRGIVLVADDEPEVRGLLRRILVTAGFQVLDAIDGDAALELVDAQPDARLLLLDLTMPRLGGVEVARQLIAQGRTLPVIMMSGYAFTQAQARLGSLEVAGFLKKPFLPGAVLAKVKRILDE